MAVENISVKLENFEGPFDLLFHLIDINEIDLYDIPISELADQFIDYIESNKDMDSMSEFVLMAATLIEIKSKMLLPKPVNPENDDDSTDPRDSLVERLIEYKRYKNVISILLEKQAAAEQSFFRQSDSTLNELFEYEPPINFDELLNGITTEDLFRIFVETVNRRSLVIDRVRSEFNSVSKDLYTIQEKIEYIENLLYLYNTIEFYAILMADSVKPEKIATFLALLELIKMKRVFVKQEYQFGRIVIHKFSSLQIV